MDRASATVYDMNTTPTPQEWAAYHARVAPLLLNLVRNGWVVKNFLRRSKHRYSLEASRGEFHLTVTTSVVRGDTLVVLSRYGVGKGIILGPDILGAVIGSTDHDIDIVMEVYA